MKNDSLNKGSQNSIASLYLVTAFNLQNGEQ